MAKRVGGFRRKTRNKLRRNIRQRGRIDIKRYLQSFFVNEKVNLSADSSYQDGMYYPRFHGKTGIVTGKQGDCYKVSIKDGDKLKKLIVHPVHLKRVK